MTGETALEPIRRSVTVPGSAERAFVHFTTGIRRWWPREYTWSQDVLEEIGLEPGAGGRCFEVGPHGFRCDWGRVVAWEAPRRLVFLWQIAPSRAPEPNPARASEVEVRFLEAGLEATRVELEHRAFERHGPGGAGYREGMASPEGWTYMLERYAAGLR
jgi:uncharacterized protein YndB with AHSA1/START domain